MKFTGYREICANRGAGGSGKWDFDVTRALAKVLLSNRREIDMLDDGWKETNRR